MGLRLVKCSDVKTLQKGANSHLKTVIPTQNRDSKDVRRDIACGEKN